MQTIIRFCICHPIFTWCLVILMVLLGVSSYSKLGVTLYPEIAPPMILVRTEYKGAAPEEIEQLITKPLEEALADLEDMKSIVSYSQDSMSLVGLEMDPGADLDLKIIDVENKIKTAYSELPKDAELPICSKMDLSTEPFLIASFSSQLSETEMRRLIDDKIKPVLSRVHGVGQVTLVGGLEREIQVILDPLALGEYNLSYQRICSYIAANSATTPSGYVTQTSDQITLRMVGEFNSVEELEELLLPTSTDHPIPLSLVATVLDGTEERRSIARANCASVVQLQISGRANANIVRAGEEIKRNIARLLSGYSELEVVYTLDDTGFVHSSVENVVRDTLIGIALTALLIYLFLGRFTVMLIVAISMPVAFAATFFPMNLHGYSLNLVTTLGLALSMGVLVDNSILVLDNIVRYVDLGYSPVDAAEKGTGEIANSVLAGVLTNLGVFLPVAMTTGIPGQLLAPFAATIIYATIISLWVTLSIIPTMAARILSKNQTTPRIGRILTGWWLWIFAGIKNLFMVLFGKGLQYPVTTLLIFVSMTIGALYMGRNIGAEMFPSSDDGTITVTLKLSNNVSLDATAEKTEQLERFIDELPEKPYIENMVSTIGATDMDQSLFKSTVSVYLADKPGRPATSKVAAKIREYLETMPGVEFSVLATRPGHGQEPIEVHVKGEDMAVLFALGEIIQTSGNAIPGIVDLTLATEAGKPELQVLPQRWRLTQIDTSIDELTEVVRGYLNGETVSTLRQFGNEYNIKVRIDTAKTNDIHTLGQLPVGTRYGLTPLDELVEWKWSDSPTEIRRSERERTLMITGNVQHISTGEGIAEMRKLLAGLDIPEGYSVQLAGEAEDMDEDFGQMGWVIAIAAITTYLVVASIIESWALAVIIFLTIPMAAIGVVPAMLATGANFSFFAAIGIVMLVGLVVNNAIVVVDYAEQLRQSEKHSPVTAIVKACEIRFKSVFLAVTTSIVSMLPLAMATGRGAEFRWPIAVVSIGGLGAGGLLALIAIPAAYKLYWQIRGVSEISIKTSIS